MNHFEYQVRTHIANLHQQADHYRKYLTAKPSTTRRNKAITKPSEIGGACTPQLAANTAAK